jgi:hypothetical protein
LKCYDGGGENEITSKKKILKLKCFSPLSILTSPLFEETHGAFLFLPLFSLFSICFLSFFFFSMLRLLGVLMIFEEKNHLFKNLFPKEMV